MAVIIPQRERVVAARLVISTKERCERIAVDAGRWSRRRCSRGDKWRRAAPGEVVVGWGWM